MDQSGDTHAGIGCLSGRSMGQVVPLAIRATGSELHFACRVDNYPHIAKAFGERVAQAIFAELCDMLHELAANRYINDCVVLPDEGGHFCLILRDAHRRPCGNDSLLARFADAWAALAAMPVERCGASFCLALSIAAPRTVVPTAAPDRDARLLGDARDVLARTRSHGAPPEPGREWAVGYRRDMATAAEFFAALSHDESPLAWQPVRSIHDDAVVLYYEALLRRYELNGEIVGVADEIALLEHLGLVSGLDRLMFDRAVAELVDVPQACLAVNISGQSVRLDPWWQARLDGLGSNRDLSTRLFVEITETAPLPGKVEALEFAHALRAAGGHLVIDGFGAGQASLWSLLAMKPDVVKIDRAYLNLAARPDHDPAILHHLVGFAKALAPAVIVDGVETADLAALASLSGADWQQGHYLGRPSTARPSAHCARTVAPLADWFDPNRRSIPGPGFPIATTPLREVLR